MMTDLEPLALQLDGKVCRGKQHVHASCRGKVAEDSARYTPALTDFIATIVTQLTFDEEGQVIMQTEDDQEPPAADVPLKLRNQNFDYGKTCQCLTLAMRLGQTFPSRYFERQSLPLSWKR